MSSYDRQGPQVQFALPRIGPALKGVLAAIAIVGIVQAILVGYVHDVGVKTFETLVVIPKLVLEGQVWRLLTAAFLTDPTSMGHLIFTLIGLYFLSPELEKNWGSWRFLRFLGIAVVVRYAFTIAVWKIAGESAPPAFHVPLAFGAGAAISAVAIAWSEMHRDRQVQLFFFLPMSGRALFWVTIGFAALGLVFPSSVPEGVAAPFGGIVTGILLGGSPSVLRRVYLQAKLAFLRRQGAAANVQPLLREHRPSRKNAPPLRVVKGGVLSDEDDKKKPKDKRFLN
ncbi:MAG TPA: rhomboid family intramembrane serine protease [Polyangiaceae bacterium]